MVAWSICFFTAVHTVAHWNNFAQLAAKKKLGFKGFLRANFASGPGWSGYIMLAILVAMVVTALEKPRKKNYERFWATHHLFIAFFVFWSVHGAFCMIKPDAPPFCNEGDSFWKFWVYGAVVYLIERLLREVRGRQVTFISKVIQHPSKVVEIQIKKEHIKTRAGQVWSPSHAHPLDIPADRCSRSQYIFLCCPEVSMWQYHPFTLTSAPEEDYVSVHVRCVGDFTRSLADALGCDFAGPKGDTSKVVGVNRIASGDNVDPTLRRVLPRLYIDGPFGSASEDVFKYEVVALVGAGIGVTPFASILKSIWYRMNYPKKKTRLRKVYFFWVCRDFDSFEWFRSLLAAIEAQDMGNHIEIHTVGGAALSFGPLLQSLQSILPSPPLLFTPSHPGDTSSTDPSPPPVHHRVDPRRRRRQHHDQRLELGPRRRHGPSRAHQLWPAQLGRHLQVHQERALAGPGRCLLLRPAAARELAPATM